MKLELAASIEQIEPAEWDGVVGARPFSRHRFLTCLERAALPHVQMWHATLRDQRRLVACTTFYSHPFRIADLYVPIRSAPGFMRRIASGVADTRAVVCGLPISLGKRHVHFAADLPGDRRRAAWRHFLDAMAELGGSGAGVLGVKEFSRADEDDAVLDELSRCSMVRCDSPPAVDLSLRWRSFAEYVAAMRSGYRRQLLADVELHATSPVRWRSRGLAEVDPAVLHQLYLNVMGHTAERFEYLSQGFWAALARYFPDRCELIVGALGREVVAYGALFHDSDMTTFMFCGMDYRYVREHATYRLLLQHIVRRAIERGSAILELGQSSYDAKERLGGTLVPRFYFLLPRNAIVRAAVRAMSPYLTAPAARPPRKVFRSHG